MVTHPASEEHLTDEQSFQEMVESIAAFRPPTARRLFPRFPTAAALSGQLETGDPDGLLLCDRERGLKVLELDEEDTRAVDLQKPFRIADFSERGMQIQFPCRDMAHFLNHSLSIRIGETVLPVQFSWCQQTPPLGRGGVTFDPAACETPDLMARIAKLGEELVRFLVTSLKSGRLNPCNPTAAYTCYALLYALRLQFREALASLWDLARGSEIQYETIQELEQSTLVVSGVRFGRWDLEDSGAIPLDSVSTLFMNPFRDFGCTLIGLHEDTLLLEQDVLAAVRRSVLLPRQRITEKVRIQPRFRFLYQSLLELRKLFPEVFGSTQFDMQFGYYSALVEHAESMKEELVYRAHESASPAFFDPFDPYGAPDQGAEAGGGLAILGPAQPTSAGSGQPVNVYIHAGRGATIACPACGTMGDFPPEQVAGLNGPRAVRCPCGTDFVAFFERRRYFRKPTKIYGRWKTDGRVAPQPMLVKDVSRGGLCFEVLAEDMGPLKGSCDLKPADAVLVEFRLDDDKRSLIRGEVVVRSVSGARIGAEFERLDPQSKKDLGFYFMS